MKLPEPCPLVDVNGQAVHRCDDLESYYEARRVELQARQEVMRKEQETRRQALETEMEAKRAETQSRMNTGTTTGRAYGLENAVERQVRNTLRIGIATVDRLEMIAVRIESRIAKIKAAGGVTTEPESLVASAKSDLSLARSNMEDWPSVDLLGERAQDNFQRIRVAAAETKEYLRTVHEKLIAAVRLLGSIQASLEVPGSSEQ